MGIQGLLPFLRDASEPVHVRQYRGQALAVDTYCWLHKGAIACAEQLARGEPADRYVGFCMKLVNMLLSHGIKPVLVFDGCTLPSKKEVEASRRERRQANLLKGKQLLREGKVSEARDCFTRCVNITHAMAHKVIKAARAQGVDCLVAPYEADAQLAYLNKAGLVQAIVTEDSDLLAFGCKKVILKLDQFGNGLEIAQARLGRCRQLGGAFTEEKLRYMCILSGCDYLPSLRGIGLAKACKVLRLANNPNIVKVIKKIGHYLKMNITVPEDYIKGFVRANNTFLYQLVFDPVRRKLVPLNPYGDDIDPAALGYAGQYIDDAIALQIALGNKDINTFEQIDDYDPDAATPAQSRSRGWDDKTPQKPSGGHSIWHRSYCPGPEQDAAPGATRRQEESAGPAGRERVVSAGALSLPQKLSALKRPRSEALSEDDLLSQYSLAFAKKTKEEGCPSSNSSRMPLPDPGGGTAIRKTVSTPPTTRNKFAAFLQRKNQECGAVVVPGTRSRFFCNSLDSMDCVSKKASPPPLEETAVTDEETSLNQSHCLGDKAVDLNEPDCLESKMLVELNESDCLDDKVDDLNESDCHESKQPVDLNESACLEGKMLVELNESDCLESKRLVERNGAHSPRDQTPGGGAVVAGEEPPSFETIGFTKTVSPPPPGTLRSCFSWSGSLGGSSRTPSPSPRTALHRFRRKGDSPGSLPEGTAAGAAPVRSEEAGDGAHPAREPRWSSQSRGGAELAPHSSGASALPRLPSKDSSPEESGCDFKSLGNQGNQQPTPHTSHFSKRDTPLRNKVPGLYKSSSLDSLSATRIKPLVPARASGLSRRPASAPKRKHHHAHHDAENRPGMQTKISELWRNFGFKKDSEKLPSCEKLGPLSPVEDNIQLTPETEEDVFHRPECARAQRAIFP